MVMGVMGVGLSLQIYCFFLYWPKVERAMGRECGSDERGLGGQWARKADRLCFRSRRKILDEMAENAAFLELTRPPAGLLFSHKKAEAAPRMGVVSAVEGCGRRRSGGSRPAMGEGGRQRD